MPNTYTTVRCDTETRSRLRALATVAGTSLADVLRRLSHTDMRVLLSVTAAAALADRKEGEA